MFEDIKGEVIRIRKSKNSRQHKRKRTKRFNDFFFRGEGGLLNFVYLNYYTTAAIQSHWRQNVDRCIIAHDPNLFTVKNPLHNSLKSIYTPCVDEISIICCLVDQSTRDQRSNQWSTTFEYLNYYTTESIQSTWRQNIEWNIISQ